MANEETRKKIRQIEKTNAMNLENLHIANTIVNSLGALYRPANPLIAAAGMMHFETGFSQRMQDLNAAISDEQFKVDAQMAAFRQVSGHVRKLLKAAAGQCLGPGFLGRLRSTVNRVTGVRAEPVKPAAAGEPAPNRNSVSRRSYAGILESLDLLDEQLKSNPDYQPNEDEYKTEAVTAWVAALRAVHHAALDAKIATRSARQARNAYAYNPADGLIVRMNAVKAYVETIIDKSDPRLRQLKKLRFVDYAK